MFVLRNIAPDNAMMEEEENVETRIEALVSFLRCPPDPTGYDAAAGILDDEKKFDGGITAAGRNDPGTRALFLKDYKDKVQELYSLMVDGDDGACIFQMKRKSRKAMLVEEVDDDGTRMGMDILLHVVALYEAEDIHSWMDDCHDVARVVGKISEILMKCNNVSSMAALIDCAMPDVLESVSDVVVAHTEFQGTISASLESYSGPSEWERVLRATEFVWLCRHWSYENLRDDEIIVMMRTLALGCNDVSERVRNISLQALYIILDIGVSNTAGMKNNMSLLGNLVSILKSSMVANDDRCWEATYAAVGKMLQVSPHHHTILMEEAVVQAVKNQHSLIFAQQWMESLKECFPCVGISMLEYTSRLYPVILEWIQALHIQLQCSILDGFDVLLKVCWPRNHAHVGPIWIVLDQVIDRQGEPAHIDQELLDRLRNTAVLLWVTSSKDFRDEKRQAHGTEELVSWAMQTCDT